jgi:dihydroflavonol-4-reductase
MSILVTGATGLLGNNVVRMLLERGEAVRVLIRPGADPRPIDGLDVEVVPGDVRDAASLGRACRDVSLVIHAAGWVHIGWTGAAAAHEVNVAGTDNVCRAALDAGARMVHVSSMNAMGIGTPDQPAHEESPRIGQIPCPYMVTKRAGEAVVQKWVAKGLHAPIVNPAFMLGPWDWKPSSGRMVLAVARRFTPVAPRGGCSVCDVRDVAAGILAADERGQPGRNYILAGENMSYYEFWRMLARVCGGRQPWMRAYPLGPYLLGHFGNLLTRLRGWESDVNSAAVQISAQYHYYNSTRAVEELGYHCRPADESAVDSWQWFGRYGYV